MIPQLIPLMLLLLTTEGKGQYSGFPFLASKEDRRFKNTQLQSYPLSSSCFALLTHPSPCRDISPVCYAIDKSYCEEPPVRKYCQATCGYCQEGAFNNEGSCEDLDQRCVNCKSICVAIPKVAQMCPKTCGLCKTREILKASALRPGHGMRPQNSLGSEGPNLSPVNFPSESSCECGIANEQPREKRYTNRIVGGKEALKNRYPWMVLIMMKRFGMVNQCGGSLINTRYVLTAGHCTYSELCTYPFSEKDLTATVADHNIHSINDDIRGVTETVNVIKIIRHEDYCLEPESATSFNHDIALLLLEKDLDLTPREVGIICLPDKASSTYEGKYVTAAGWGLNSPTGNDHGGTMPESLQEVSFKVMNDCRTYRIKHHITGNMFCAGDPEKIMDACSGDSGGPIIYKDQNNRYVQIGLVSFGPPGANCTGLGVYTTITHYIDWIKENTRDGKCH